MFSCSKNGPIRSFSPINRGRHAHVHGSELNFNPKTWVCRPLFIGLNDRIARFFDPWKVESVYSQGGNFFNFGKKMVWTHKYTRIFALNSNLGSKSAQMRPRSQFWPIFKKNIFWKPDFENLDFEHPGTRMIFSGLGCLSPKQTKHPGCRTTLSKVKGV